jgi:FkbM family methyltransferase
MKAHLRSGMGVIDLGAHIGYFSLVAASLVGPTGAVWSFEPDPDNRRVLELNVATNSFADRIHVVGAAVAGNAGEGTLYQFSADGSSSSLVARQGQLSGSLQVELTTLDSWAADFGWPRVDLVKMDIEGGEVPALEGMRELCDRNPRMALVVELNTEALEASGLQVDTFFDVLRKRGFTKWSVIHHDGLRRIRVHSDITKTARSARWEPLNLFCERMN